MSNFETIPSINNGIHLTCVKANCKHQIFLSFELTSCGFSSTCATKTKT